LESKQYRMSWGYATVHSQIKIKDPGEEIAPAEATSVPASTPFSTPDTDTTTSSVSHVADHAKPLD